jgi:hypothetical protein
MSDELVIRGKRGDFNDYEKFITKFKAAKTTDDCYTPQPIYEAVVDYVFRKGNLPEDTEIVRPFRPNGDYTTEEYPEGCVVIDNPPFSILSKIVRFYIARGIKFFLFAPTLTLFSSASSSYCTKIVCGVSVTYANKAKVATSFLTNIFGDNAIICDNELYNTIEEIDKRLQKESTKELTKIIYPDNVVSAALLQKVAKRLTLVIPASEMKPIKSAGGTSIFGGGYLLSSKAAAERAAAERAAAERAAAERAAAEIVKLTPQELRMIDELDGKIKPFYDQTLF